MIKIELPWPPSLNHYKITGATILTRNGKMFQKRVNSHETTRYFYEVWMKVRMSKLESFGSDRLRVSVRLHAPNHRRLDLDNHVKVLLDALQKANLYDDDSQIDSLLIERGENSKPHGKVIVSIDRISV